MKKSIFFALGISLFSLLSSQRIHAEVAWKESPFSQVKNERPFISADFCLDTQSKRKALIQDIISATNKYINAHGYFNSDGYPREGLFSGSWDWHSSVHAHWTLLSAAYSINANYTLDQTLARFTPSKLLKERKFLKENEQHDYYGQAWLLLLISELKKYYPPYQEPQKTPTTLELESSVPYQLQQLEKETFARVSKWLLKNDSNANICSGSYYSWPMMYALVRLSNPAPENNEVMRTLQQKFQQSGKCTTEEQPSEDYVQVGALMDLLGKSNGYIQNKNTNLKPVAKLSTEKAGHEALSAISSYWRMPGIETSQPKNKTECRTFDKYLYNLSIQKSTWSGNFETLGHVAPQFIWFGMWLDQEVYFNKLRENAPTTSTGGYQWP